MVVARRVEPRLAGAFPGTRAGEKATGCKCRHARRTIPFHSSDSSRTAKKACARPDWDDKVAISIVEKCLGHGDEMGLSISVSGYNFDYWGVGGGGSARPSGGSNCCIRAVSTVSTRPECDSSV